MHLLSWSLFLLFPPHTKSTLKQGLVLCFWEVFFHPITTAGHQESKANGQPKEAILFNVSVNVKLDIKKSRKSEHHDSCSGLSRSYSSTLASCHHSSIFIIGKLDFHTSFDHQNAGEIYGNLWSSSECSQATEAQQLSKSRSAPGSDSDANRIVPQLKWVEFFRSNYIPSSQFSWKSKRGPSNSSYEYLSNIAIVHFRWSWEKE